VPANTSPNMVKNTLHGKKDRWNFGQENISRTIEAQWRFK